MNIEYRKRIKRANDASNDFFNKVKETGNMEMLQKDEDVVELYLQAFDVAGQSTEEEKDFYYNYSGHYEYKAYFLVASGEFAKKIGNKKILTTSDLKPIYNALTEVIDEAIAQNDKYKPDYLRHREEIISEFNKTLEEFGFSMKKGGCYIATAVYGSYDCPQVWALRRYRDEKLARHFYGRIFIHVYYAVSPVLVKYFGGNEWFIRLWRKPLDVIVEKILNAGYENTPYTDFLP